MPLLLLLFAAVAVSLASAAFPSPVWAAPNILLIVADDVGVDNIGVYTEHPDAPPTPVIDGLAARGVLFRNAWSSAVCTPARAAILTGLLPYVTGMGGLPNAGAGLHEDEVSIADVLKAEGYQTFAVGKWHVAPSGSSMTHPLRLGFDTHRGSRGNLKSFTRWKKYIDGVMISRRYGAYATTDSVNDASTLILRATGPWFMLLAFNAAHAPFHSPPPALHTYDLDPNPDRDMAGHYRAAVQAMDTEIGRLFAELDAFDPAVLANTVVIFVGDNGTPKFAVLAPLDPLRAKGTIYEGGVNVPLVISGPAVASAAEGTENADLVHVTDLFSTIADVAGASYVAPQHSISMQPCLSGAPATGRAYLYTEKFDPSGFGVRERDLYAVRDDRYKLLQPAMGEPFEMYDLSVDPLEKDDLLLGTLTPEQQSEFAALVAALPPVAACANGLDDDADGRIDLADPGCVGVNDPSEKQLGIWCDDDRDNDGDGDVDVGQDAECQSPFDPTEDLVEDCHNGLDDDGDGFVDYDPTGGDPGCTFPGDPSELNPGVECDDGVDNDGDLLTDSADPVCAGEPARPSETAQCQDGIDNDPNRHDGVDFDGGMSINGFVDPMGIDPACILPGAKGLEKAHAVCGLGGEIAVVLLLLPATRRRLARTPPRA